MKKVLSLLLCLSLLCGLTACGGSSKSNAMMYAADMSVEEAMGAPAAMANTTASRKEAESGSTTLPEGRKWIITMDIRVETDDLDATMADLDQKISSLGGYVEDQNIHNGSNYATHRYRSANLTVRIPEDKVDSFTDEVSGMTNVVSQNLRREDITLQYVSTSSRITALETEEARLLELLAMAETMEDLLEIEARLTDVRYELENYASQLRIYDNQVDYATIYLSIEEVQEYTPVEERGFFERIQTTFSDSLEALGDGIVNIIVFLVGNSPCLVALAILAAAVIALVKRIRKAKAQKKAKKEEQK